jgi:thiamine biosynthesis protein ThiC
MTTTDKNRYMAEYMRRYRARKAAERDKLRAQAEHREPETQMMLTQILEAVTALSERVARMEVALTRNANELTETNVKPGVSKLTKANVNTGKQRSDSSTVEELAKEAQALHVQGLSYEQIAKRWTEAGIPTLKGGRWHKGIIAKIIQRHAGQ